MPIILTEQKYNEVKGILSDNEGITLRKAAQMSLVSAATACYIKNSKDYKDYRKKLALRNTQKQIDETFSKEPEAKGIKGFFKNLFNK